MLKDQMNICPNCGRDLKLEKAGGWKALNEVESMACISGALLMGMGVFMGLKIANDCSASLELTPIHYLGAFLLTVFVSLPFTVMWMVKYSKANLERLGICVYHIECTCGNCYTIARSIQLTETNTEQDMVITDDCADTAH